jgi:hypothetical protein
MIKILSFVRLRGANMEPWRLHVLTELKVKMAQFNRGLHPVHDRIIAEALDLEEMQEFTLHFRDHFGLGNEGLQECELQMEEFMAKFYRDLEFPQYQFEFKPSDLEYLEEFDQLLSRL